MHTIQTFTDKAAIGLSLICAFHCLATPSLVVLLPSLTALNLNNEALHTWMIIVVIPTSTYALTMGCKQHKRFQLLAFGVIGITCLVLAIVLAESLLGETGEKLLTTVGAAIIAYGHYKNYRLCQHHKNCNCSRKSNG